MDATAFRIALGDLGLTQVGAARFLDLDERTLRRWATGDATVPRSVQALFAVMAKHSLTVDEVLALIAAEA